MSFLKKIFGSAHDRLLKKYGKIVNEVNKWDEIFKSLTDEELKNKTIEFRQRLQAKETLDHLLPEAYAVVKNVCRRLMGTEVHVSGYNQKWDMIPYDVQILGAIAMHYGAIAEMQTGEGKTLTAVLALYLNALTQKPVHLVTVNDYLSERDCEWVGTILRWLGLSTGALTGKVPIHERKKIYESDVVYGTASEFGFDYLRDNSMAITEEEQVQRGYYFAIIDEVDSILIDEARTPLIISGPVPNSRQMYDELKSGVAELVRLQKELCNRLANEAKKVLEIAIAKGENYKRTKQEEQEEQEAYRKLWLVGKGTPKNKVLKRLKEHPFIRSAIDKWDLYYHSDQNKEEKLETLAQLYMLVDERGNEYELTDKGIHAWQNSTQKVGHANDFVMMDISARYIEIDEDDSLSEEEKMARKFAIREEDALQKERAHNIRQLLRAYLLMSDGEDYIIEKAVVNGAVEEKIVIVDENTGRPQPGRRFSDGLHQAIEAKEGVKVQKETQTYATITLQNYFRMYEKLSGMTGTASTEAQEFKEIYKLDVLAIPSHKPCKRKDHQDLVYMTLREKYYAVLEKIRALHEKGQPILLGTESVDISEKLSRILTQNNLPHTVLNAKHHSQEAEIIAGAGQRGAITIATNMAGRGTDIKLGEGVAALGGLFIIGTSRHPSRRTDRQLKGRSGRQGDPGESLFFISFEDSLTRMFLAPGIISNFFNRMRPPEGEAISAPMITKAIENAQKKVEQRNYTLRKHTLEYDDVMNKQRKEIYAFRNEVLHSKNIEETVVQILESVCHQGFEEILGEKVDFDSQDLEKYRQWLLHLFPITFEPSEFDKDFLEPEEVIQNASEKVIHHFKEKMRREELKIPPSMMYGDQKKPLQEALKNLIIHKIDRPWKDHLLRMDHLRSDVMLRVVGQRDPLMEFKHEAFSFFDELTRYVRTDIAASIFLFEIIAPEPSFQSLPNETRLETNRFLFENEGSQDIEEVEENPMPEEQLLNENISFSGPRVGRNELCPCGSGKKYKKCCQLEVVK